MEFNELGIRLDILDALYDSGYETPTPIQEQTIPAALEGKDVLGLAQTGTGKTAAFAVPTLQRLIEGRIQGKKRKIRALVLTPTRELGTQIYESFQNYGQHVNIRSTVVFGGVSQGRQVNALRSGIDILVATPGRLIDLINQGYIDLSSIEIFILDEADRMLDMGFIHDIRRIIKMVPRQKQTMLFSATMPEEIEEIVAELLVDPVKITVAPVSSTIDTVTQYVQFVDQGNKSNLLAEYINKNTNGQPVLVFTRTKRGADRVVKDLTRRRISVQAIHGNKSQNARQNALDNFKNYGTQVLVATDIASRGIDIHELEYVVNYDLPDVPETYVHRIGRTGRAGHSGTAISFVSYKETPLLKDIETLTNQTITVLENTSYPMVDETVSASVQRKMDRQANKVNHKPRTRKRDEDVANDTNRDATPRKKSNPRGSRNDGQKEQRGKGSPDRNVRKSSSRDDHRGGSQEKRKSRGEGSQERGLKGGRPQRSEAKQDRRTSGTRDSRSENRGFGNDSYKGKPSRSGSNKSGSQKRKPASNGKPQQGNGRRSQTSNTQRSSQPTRGRRK